MARTTGCGERATQGLTVVVAAGVALWLLFLPTLWFASGLTGTFGGPGGTEWYGYLTLAGLGVLVFLPYAVAHRFFRAGLRRGDSWPAAAVPAALALLGAAVVSVVLVFLMFVFAGWS